MNVYVNGSAAMAVALVILLRYFGYSIRNTLAVWLTVCFSFKALLSAAMCRLVVCTVQKKQEVRS